jgi:polysaccharide chain length determinant protein (PEP-CTERM system associated)
MLPGKKITLADILQVAKRRVWLICLPPAFLFFGALVYSSTVPNVYQSDMLIAIDPQRVPDAFVRSTVTLATDLRVEAITVQVLSRTTLQRLIETLDLYPEERKLMPMEDVIVKMRAAVQIRLERPRPQWGMPSPPTAFHVLFTYRDPEMAAKVTQLIGTRFVEQNVRDRGSLAGATNRFLETQLEESRSRLEAQEQRLEAFRQRHGPELPTQMQSNMQAQMSTQLQAQGLVESIARDRDRKQLLERLYRDAANEPIAPATLATAPGAPPDAQAVSGTTRQQLTAARTLLANLERRYQPEHPDVTRTRRLVSELEETSKAEAAAESSRPAVPGLVAEAAVAGGNPVRTERLRQMAAEIESLDRQIAFKESEERRVRGEITEYRRRLEAVPGLESEWTALTRDYDTQQSNYRELLAKSSMAQVAVNLEEQEIGERFRIVDAAEVPVHPLPAVRGRINAGAFAVGLIIGLGLTAILMLKDASFRSDADVLEVLALPVLASVPRVITTAEKARRHRRRLAFSTAGAMCIIVAGYVTWTLKLWNSLI